MQTVNQVSRGYLFPFEACLADHLAPLARLVIDELAELSGRAAMRFQSLGKQLLFHVGIGKCASNFILQSIDDRTRRAGWRHEAVPPGSNHVGQALLTQGGSLGINGAASGGSRTQHAELAALNIR